MIMKQIIHERSFCESLIAISLSPAYDTGGKRGGTLLIGASSADVETVMMTGGKAGTGDIFTACPYVLPDHVGPRIHIASYNGTGLTSFSTQKRVRKVISSLGDEVPVEKLDGLQPAECILS